MTVTASQITSALIACLNVCSGADLRQHQSSASLTFLRGIHRWLMNFPHKLSVTWKTFLFDDAIMCAIYGMPHVTLEIVPWLLAIGSKMAQSIESRTEIMSDAPHDHHSDSNHEKFDCLFNSSFRLVAQSTWKLCITGLLWEGSASN